MEAERLDGATPATVTALIAERVKALRTGARLSGPALAVEMNKLGIPWNRTTVAKLETGRRETVTVQELLALALVLEVPPVWLLADPADGPVPIAAGIEVDPPTALLWMIGKDRLPGQRGGAAWDDAAEAITALYRVASVVKHFRTMRAHHETTAAALGDRPAHVDDVERSLLMCLPGPLNTLNKLGYQLPPLPAELVKRAAELGGVEFPGHEG